MRACGWCHVKTENEILTGEIKLYVKDMSGHKFAQCGGDVVQICVFRNAPNIINVEKATYFFNKDYRISRGIRDT